MNRRSEVSVPIESFLWMCMWILKCTLCQSLSLLKTFSPSRMYNGPMKSNPVWANGRSRDTCSIGKSEVGGGLYGARTLLQVALFLKICFTTSRPLGTQNLSRIVVKVSLKPLCLILECTSWMVRLVSGCLDGRKTGFLLLQRAVQCLLFPYIWWFVGRQGTT